MNLNLPAHIKEHKRAILFVLLFLGILLIFSIGFEYISKFYAVVFLKPLSFLAYKTLQLFSVTVTFDTQNLNLGYCDLRLPGQILRVNYGCVGIYTLFILISGILAFPASFRSKITGIIFVLPIFYLYSLLRIIIMGFVGSYWRQQFEFFHSYLMLILNVVIILFLFIVWLEKIKPRYESEN